MSLSETPVAKGMAAAEQGAPPLLRVVDLTTRFDIGGVTIHATEGVSLDVRKAEIVAVVGESGSGKSVTALSAMRLIPEPPGKIVRGHVLLDGEDLFEKSPEEMRHVRGGRISMIFQNPYAALNPLLSLGDQLVETLRLHRDVGRGEARDIAETQLGDLGIPEPDRILKARSFEASGGTNQRVMLALALAGEPELLIADEPTTMLDAITQLEIFRLILRIRSEMNMSVWLITHDFGAVAKMADRVVVMYAGAPVEWADAATIMKTPKHPYTAGLIDSVPAMGDIPQCLSQIPGEPPDLRHLPPGCPFAPRCPRAMDICRVENPPSFHLQDDSDVRCWLYDEEAERAE